MIYVLVASVTLLILAGLWVLKSAKDREWIVERIRGKPVPMRAYKLMRLRKDGTLGPLFINATMRVPMNEWLDAEDHPTKGYKHRPGWHVLPLPIAPHLTTKGRVWVRVEILDYVQMTRATHQGGVWYLAKKMRIVEILQIDHDD